MNGQWSIAMDEWNSHCKGGFSCNGHERKQDLCNWEADHVSVAARLRKFGFGHANLLSVGQAEGEAAHGASVERQGWPAQGQAGCSRWSQRRPSRRPPHQDRLPPYVIRDSLLIASLFSCFFLFAVEDGFERQIRSFIYSLLTMWELGLNLERFLRTGSESVIHGWQRWEIVLLLGRIAWILRGWGVVCRVQRIYIHVLTCLLCFLLLFIIYIVSSLLIYYGSKFKSW